MKYLIALDLEGVHGIVGREYEKLSRGLDTYDAACEAAALEVNACAAALCDEGAELVALWDNHGNGNNLDMAKVDERVVRVDFYSDDARMDFADGYDFDRIIFLGYHAKEGTPRAVLAHTFNSSDIQYVRLGGEDIGELAVDTYLAYLHGMTPMLIAADDVAIDEMKGICPDIQAVMTKWGEGRNRATLRKREDVLDEIYEATRRTARAELPPFEREFPQGSVLEVRYTRAERADEVYQKWADKIPTEYGEDTHILRFVVNSPREIQKFL